MLSFVKARDFAKGGLRRHTTTRESDRFCVKLQTLKGDHVLTNIKIIATVLLTTLFAACSGSPSSDDVVKIFNTKINLSASTNVKTSELKITNMLPGIDDNHKKVDFQVDIIFENKSKEIQNIIAMNEKSLEAKAAAIQAESSKEMNKIKHDPSGMIMAVMANTAEIKLNSLMMQIRNSKTNAVGSLYNMNSYMHSDLINQVTMLSTVNTSDSLKPIVIQKTGTYSLIKSSNGWIEDK